MGRRGLLRGVGAGLAVVVAGCSSVAETLSPPPYLEAARVKNTDVLAHQVRVVVAQRGDTVHEATFELGEREPREYGGPYRPWEQVDCEWAGRGPFEVTCTVDGTEAATARVDKGDTDAEQRYVTVEFRIRDTGAVDLWYVGTAGQSDHTRCDEPTPTPQ